jgi:hypothetical protein
MKTAVPRSLVVSVCLVVALVAAKTSAADTAPIQVVNGLPWADPNHQSTFENFVGPIASRIASRTVSMRCEGETDWQKLTTDRGFDPRYELGYVGTLWFTRVGVQVGGPTISPFAELAPSVCLPLQNFAMAPAKPTKCSQTITETVTEMQPQTSREKREVRVRVKVKGKMVWRTVTKMVTVTKQVPTQVQHQTQGPLAPCFMNDTTLPMTDPFYWTNYRGYALAMFALAHESLHLGGIVGGRLSNGVLVGDQQAEAKANCYGMQWIPWVATQLGATLDDGIAIARYTYLFLYPGYRGTAYWSADCVAGGAMDIRADKSGHWP